MKLVGSVTGTSPTPRTVTCAAGALAIGGPPVDRRGPDSIAAARSQWRGYVSARRRADRRNVDDLHRASARCRRRGRSSGSDRFRPRRRCTTAARGPRVASARSAPRLLARRRHRPSRRAGLGGVVAGLPLLRAFSLDAIGRAIQSSAGAGPSGGLHAEPRSRQRARRPALRRKPRRPVGLLVRDGPAATTGRSPTGRCGRLCPPFPSTRSGTAATCGVRSTRRPESVIPSCSLQSPKNRGWGQSSNGDWRVWIHGPWRCRTTSNTDAGTACLTPPMQVAQPRSEQT